MRTAFLLVMLLSSTVLVTAVSASAVEDHLVLNDGRVIAGTYLGGDDQEVRFLYTNAEMVIPRRRVTRIDFAVQPSARPVTFLSEPAQPAVVQPQPTTVYVQQPPTTVYVQQPTVRYVEVERERPQPRWNVSIGWYAGPWMFGHHHGFGPSWGIGYSNWYGCR